MDNGSYRVLLVEGNTGDALRFQEMLRESDATRFELTHVARLGEALHYLARSPSDVILLDLGLPDERGLDTFVRTHTEAPETPIVILAGTEDTELALKAVRRGAQDFLVKGEFDGGSLVRSACLAIERKQAEMQTQRLLQESMLFSEVTMLIASARDVSDALQKACARLSAFLQVPQAGFAVINATSTSAEVIADYCPPGSPQAMGIELPVAGNPSMAYIVEHKAPLAVTEAQTDPRLAPVHAVMRQRNVASLLIVPVLVDGQVLGTLGFDTYQRRVFSDSEIELVQRIASQMGQVVKRKRVEQALRESEQKFRLVVEQSQDGITLANERGLVVEWNKAMEDITGLRAEETLNRPAWDVQAQLSLQENRNTGMLAELQTATRQALKSGEAPDLGTVMVQEIERPDGTRQLVERVRFPIRTERGYMLAAVSRDVTNRRQVEEARKEAFNIVNMSPAVAFLWKNEPGWPVEYVTGTVERMLGYSREELISGQIPYSQIVHPQDLERVAQEVAIASQREAKHAFVHEPYRIITKGGKIRWLDDRTHIRRNQTGTVTHFQGVVFDITELRLAEQRLEASLREKETLLQEIHHRVKNNLQVVASLLELQASSSGDEEIYQIFQDSQSRIRTMGLVHEKLYRSTDLENIEASDYLQELLEYLFGLYGSVGRPISHSLKIVDVMLGVDLAILCGLIVNELVSNAFKHAFPPDLEREGHVRVELRVVEGSQLALIVADNGVGLPPELRPNDIQTLGLQLVSLLTQQLAGKLEIDSGVGARFTVCFPSRKQARRDGEQE